MIRGHVDAVTQSGFIEGWAFDDERKNQTLKISVVNQNNFEIAGGYAHLFRSDLAEVDFGYGWCAFRFFSSVPSETLVNTKIKLYEFGTQKEICSAKISSIQNNFEILCDSVEKILLQDPTVLSSIMELRSCNSILENYIDKHGIIGFIRASYIYVLNRPADKEGISNYERLLRIGAITPFGLLAVLADSKEFYSRPRQLSPPNSPAFIFGLTA